MKTTVLGIVAALLFAAPAFADLTPEEQFQDALEGLLDAISGEIENLDGDLEKDEKKILKALRKADKIGGSILSIQLDPRRPAHSAGRTGSR